MTAIAALVAEAIQLARESTPPLVNECARVTYRGTDSAWAWYTRDDVRDAALTHLATRAAEAEGRAERAERQLERAARLGWIAVTRIHALNRYEEGRAAYDEAAEARLTKDAEWLAEACANGEAADDDWEKYERVAEEALAEDAEKEAGRG